MAKRMNSYAEYQIRNNLSKDSLNKSVYNEEEKVKKKTAGFARRSKIVFSGIFVGLTLMVIVLMCFLVTHFETNRQLKDLNRNDRYLHDLTKQLTELNMEIKSGAIGNKYRSSRVDYAQYSQGAKVLKFQGVEIPMVASVSDTLRQLFGFFVPRGACRVLGKHMTKNTFLAFKGNKAALKIKLNQRIFLDTIRIDHYIDDLRNPEMISAMPKDLSFYGYRDNSTDPVYIGSLQMSVNMNSKSQSGAIHLLPKDSYEIYKIEILSNHGNNDMTRFYKIRMHGQVDDLH